MDRFIVENIENIETLHNNLKSSMDRFIAERSPRPTKTASKFKIQYG